MAQIKSRSPSFWDDRYSGESSVYGEAPDAYLASQQRRLKPGMKALVPGDGEGRNGVWLAEQGLVVTTVDLSAVGVRNAAKLADQRGVALTALQADLTNWEWPDAQFDLVVSIFLHLAAPARRQIHAAMMNALRPGGLLVIEAFRPEQVRYREEHGASGGPPAAEMMFSEAILREDFNGADVLELESVDVHMGDEGSHSGLTAVVRGVFRKRRESA